MISHEDNLEIRQLLYRYGFAADDRDWEEIGRIFTTDAVFDSSLVGFGVVEGRDAIVAHLAKRTVPTAHLFVNVVVTGNDATPDEAVARAKAMTPDTEGRLVVTTIRSHVVRTSDGWRIQRQICDGLLRPGPALTRS